MHEHGDQDVTKELAIWKINFDEEACVISIHSWQQQQHNLEGKHVD